MSKLCLRRPNQARIPGLIFWKKGRRSVCLLISLRPLPSPLPENAGFGQCPESAKMDGQRRRVSYIIGRLEWGGYRNDTIGRAENQPTEQ